MENEIWKDVVGYEGLYQVSNLGRVRGLDRLVKHSGEHMRIQKGRILKGLVHSKDGYVYVGLYKKGKYKKIKVHRLVGLAFIENPQNKPMINHIDENKENNKLDNLEWCTAKENENHGTKRERMKKNTDYSLIASKYKKPVIQYDLEGNVIKEWDSIKQIKEENGYSSGNISNCCNGKLKKTYGYVWRFAKHGKNLG